MNIIKKIRTENKLSQAELAKMLNVHQTAVSQWENGRTTPDVTIAKLISKQFGVSLDELLGNETLEISQTTHSPESILDDVEFAFYGEFKDFTEEEKQDLIDFVQFIKSKRKDN